jgi:hypothetical protein
LTGGETTINPDGERVIDNCGADRSKLAIKLRDGVRGIGWGMTKFGFGAGKK